MKQRSLDQRRNQPSAYTLRPILTAIQIIYRGETFFSANRVLKLEGATTESITL